MTLLSKLMVIAVIGILAALALPAYGRAYTRAQERLEAARAWHQARLELQLLTMDFPEAEAQLAQAVNYFNSNQP